VFGVATVKSLDAEDRRYQSDLDLLRKQSGRLREILNATPDALVEKLSTRVYVMIDISISINKLRENLTEIEPIYE
jgi:hypothetical protein